ncbi:MAG: DUF2800 domain-containing protein [Lachnospiraceae bacterium]|nr:DUF2800 domain-containing protein [Lachnospiraceae bacterium]
MNWNRHTNLEGSHAFLGASKYGWLNKDSNELIESYRNSFAVSIGTLLHSYAADCIRFRERLRKTDAKAVKFDLMRRGIPEFAIDIQAVFPNLMNYVNDAVGYQMDPEVTLYYSDFCFGTTDSICVGDGILRIHDLKTGTTPAKMDQLMVYAALFYLEYGFKPEKLRPELRIYQSDEVIIHAPELERVLEVMDRIVEGDRVLQLLKEE